MDPSLADETTMVAKVKPDLVKQGEESFGVQMSFQYRKALEK